MLYPPLLYIKDPRGHEEGSHLSTPHLLSCFVCLYSSHFYPSYLPSLFSLLEGVESPTVYIAGNVNAYMVAAKYQANKKNTYEPEAGSTKKIYLCHLVKITPSNRDLRK
jgi:hypothetical protein